MVKAAEVARQVKVLFKIAELAIRGVPIRCTASIFSVPLGQTAAVVLYGLPLASNKLNEMKGNPRSKPPPI